ncbi:hypothetical protein AHAS_Ahas12G0161300 [Arachis hypogaea]
MDSGVIFLSLRRRKLPSLEAFLMPVDLSDAALIRTVVAVVGDLVTGFSDHRFPFQRKNSHSLIRKIEVFQLLLESLRDSRVRALLEGALFAVISFQQILLDYCAQLSKAVDLSNNVREQIELLRRQSRRARLFVDEKDDVVRIKFFSFLEAFENERIPCSDELRRFYVDELKSSDARNCVAETEVLEEQIVDHEGEIGPTISVLN